MSSSVGDAGGDWRSLGGLVEEVERREEVEAMLARTRALMGVYAIIVPFLAAGLAWAENYVGAMSLLFSWTHVLFGPWSTRWIVRRM